MTPQPRPNARRRALLAALSASAAALTAGQARADIITFNVNQNFGFNPGDSGYSQFTLQGSRFILGRFQSSRPTNSAISSPQYINVRGFLGIFNKLNSTRFSGSFKNARAGNAKTFDQVPGPIDPALRTVTVSSRQAPLAPASFYTLFRFADHNRRNAYDYGYASVQLKDGSYNNFRLYVDKLVYDNTGARIATPSAAVTSVPEPSTLTLCALGALASGAVGLRRWRTGKAQAAGAATATA